jgi:hypothetical protein
MCVVTVAVVRTITASPQGSQQRVAFVGCPSDGQAGYIERPGEEPRMVTVTEVSAGEVAYYKGAMAPGAYAPTGWHCHVWYGSGGGHLLVTPEVLDSAPGSAWPPKTTGPAVELSLYDSGASGRYEVAKYALLFFPQADAKFIQRVNEDLDVKISQPSLRAFAKDSINRISDNIAAFVTPSNTTGFGTEQYLGPSSDPISGVAFLDQSNPYGPNFVALRVRLKTTNTPLESALLRLNRECMNDGGGCSTR